MKKEQKKRLAQRFKHEKQRKNIFFCSKVVWRVSHLSFALGSVIKVPAQAASRAEVFLLFSQIESR
jgi:hypothetical protein